MYLPENASAAAIRIAQRARYHRQQIIQALSHGQVSRRELLKMGLLTAAGGAAFKYGLHPFLPSARASDLALVPRSPLFGANPFTVRMPRFNLFKRSPIATLSPAPLEQANTAPTQVLGPDGVAVQGPKEGRPPGPMWAHQGWYEFPPVVAVEATQHGADVCDDYDPGVPPFMNSGILATDPVRPCFHPRMPDQSPTAMWTFDGNAPPNLLLARYGEPILFRHHNALPGKVTDNNGFGRNTISTHEHNGHHGAENDGFTGAWFYPGQFYDYHWPVVHAGFRTYNTAAGDRRCGTPNGSGGITNLPGDWRETMSTHWFHDHMFSFTSQNVYKGNAAMMNIYSSLDRGNEEIEDGVNLRLPSGSAKDWGNLEYDVNLLLSDKAFDPNGQLTFDIFDFDGFVGDVMMVNHAYRPYFEVLRRKYRFRILNGAVGRFFKLALSNAAPIIQIGNDGNLLPRAVQLTELDEMGIAERYDVVIDFSAYSDGTKIYLVNLAEHSDGRRVDKHLSVREAMSGQSDDPCVGPILEFRVKGQAPIRDPSRDFSKPGGMNLIEVPDHASVPIARRRTFEFGRGAKQVTRDAVSSALGPWGVKTDGGDMLDADFGRVSAAPRPGTREIWTLVNGGGGWDHPIHIHFEEGLILARDGSASLVPPWERGRKDVYRLRPGGSITVSLQFRDWGGMFMEHCHNTVHEDNAMLLRWQLGELQALPTPIPSPTGVRFQAPTQVLPSA